MFLEMLEILGNNKAINNQTDTERFNDIYSFRFHPNKATKIFISPTSVAVDAFD